MNIPGDPLPPPPPPPPPPGGAVPEAASVIIWSLLAGVGVVALQTRNKG